MAKISPQEVRTIFNYVSDGTLIWRVKSGKAKPGKIAGSSRGVGGNPGSSGYWRIIFKRRRYYAHHLVWAYHHNEWPKFIDHINGINTDNRIENLRKANSQTNGANSRQRTSTLKGTTGRSNGRWISQITVDYKNIYLGSFSIGKRSP